MSADRARFRAHARRRVRLRVVVSHPRGSWQREVEVRDLGLGGACVALGEPLEAGDEVVLSFVAPTLWDPLRLEGRVAWVGPAGERAGIAFRPGDGAQVFALFELLGAVGYSE